MKTIIAIIIAAFCSVATNATTSNNVNDITIGLSPFRTQSERATEQALLQRFLLADCPNGSRVTIWDALNLRVIVDVKLASLAYDSPQARAVRVGPALASLKRWSDEMSKSPAPAGLSDAIKFPEWLQLVTVQRSPGRCNIVVLASPFYFPSETAFSLSPDHYPSDGHLSHTVSETPYGIIEKQGRLANVNVLWSFPSSTSWGSELHRENVARFWALFIAGQGGLLARFDTDSQQVLLAAPRSEHRAISDYSINPDDNALVMHVTRRREVAVEKHQAVSPPQSETLPEPEKIQVPTPGHTNHIAATSPSSTASVAIPLELPKPAADANQRFGFC